MLRRLRVRGYKSLVNCEVEFSRLTVVVGPNGAGKSNLLDLVALLSRLAYRDTVRDALAEPDHRGRPIEAFHSREGFGTHRYESILSEGRRSFSVECDIELHPRHVEEVNRALRDREHVVGSKTAYTRVSEPLLRYTVEVAIHPGTGEIFVADERLQALRRDLEPKTSREPFFGTDETKTGARRLVARIERQSHPRYFAPDRPRTLLSELSDPVYHPHVVAAAREIASWRAYYVEPTRMIERIGVQTAEEPGRRGELLAAYYWTLQKQAPAVLSGIVRNLREFVPGLESLRVDVNDGVLELVATFNGGSEFPARLLSEGTLRLLCMVGLCVAPRPPAVVVYEEPENGVSPGRLALLADMLRNAVSVRPDGPQFILTTHSLQVCELLPENLVLCSWDAAGGTRFRPLEWDREDLYFRDSLRGAVDDATRSGPVPWTTGVAEDEPRPR